MISFDIEGELDTDTYKPMQKGELGSVKLTNKSRRRIVVSKVLLTFRWMGSSSYFTECSVDVPPKSTEELPKVRFKIDFGVPVGNNNYKIGVAYEMLEDDQWKHHEDYVLSGEHIEIKPLPSKNYIVFVSHSNNRADNKLILSCRSAFKACGIKSYFAEDDKRGGSILWEKLLKRINESDAFLILWTASASQSGDVREEIGIALNSHLKNRVVPIVERGVQVQGSLKTRGKEWVDYSRPNNADALSGALKTIMQWAKRKESLGRGRGTKNGTTL